MKTITSCAISFDKQDEAEKKFKKIKKYIFENYEGQDNKIVYSGKGLKVKGKAYSGNIKVKIKPNRIVVRGNDSEIINNIVKSIENNN